ncbi:MAG: hypothetical protein QM775_36195 [Pirellulales bacterium]
MDSTSIPFAKARRDAGRQTPTAEHASAAPRRIILWVCIDTHFREMARLARMLRQEGRHEPYILFAEDYPLIAADFETCRREQFEFGHFRRPVENPAPVAIAPPSQSPVPAKRRLRIGIGRTKRVVGAVRNRFRETLSKIPFCRMIFDAVSVARVFSRQFTMARECLAEIEADVLVLPEDNVEYSTAAFIRAAHELHMPAIVIPYSLCNAQEPAEAYYNHPAYQAERPLNRLVCKFFPKWKLNYRGRNLVRMPAAWIIAREYLKLGPPNPWLWNSGDADCYVVDSRAAYHYYVDCGQPAERTRVLGSLRQDNLAAFRRAANVEREKLLAEQNLPRRDLLVVCAFPPFQAPMPKPGCEFANYRELCEAWLAELADVRERANVIVVPHPRMSGEEVAFLKQQGLPVVSDDIVRCLAVADVYVASVSATIATANSCGIPVINYDVYAFDYDDYKQVPGVLAVRTRAAFREQLQKLTGDAEYRAEVRRAQQAVASHWGVLDGEAGRRLCDLMEELVAVRRPGAVARMTAAA